MMTKLWHRLYHETEGALDEIMSASLGIVFILFFVVPPITEFISGYMQGQELEQLTTTAAQKACALLAKNEDIKGNETYQVSRQGALGVLLDANQTYALMNQAVLDTFAREARNPSDIPEENIELKLMDVYDNDISQGAEAQGYPAGYIGANPGRHLCPTVNLEGVLGMSMSRDLSDPAWCLKPQGAVVIKKMFQQGKTGQLDQATQDKGVPASIKQQLFQAGRKLPEQNIPSPVALKRALQGKLYKCVVTAEKKRRYIFAYAGIGPVHIPINTLLPPIIRKQSDARFHPENAADADYRALSRNSSMLSGEMYHSYELNTDGIGLVRDLITDADKACENNPNCIDKKNIMRIEETRAADDSLMIDKHIDVKSDFFEDDNQKGFEVIDQRVEDLD